MAASSAEGYTRFLKRLYTLKKFTAYFDASGDETSPVVSVAGFVARTERWIRFQDEWRSLLSVNPNVDHFHMTDFVSRRKGWQGWKAPDTDRLIHGLIACIRRNLNKGFANALSKATFDSVNRRHELSANYQYRYLIAAGTCIGGLRKWAKRKRVSLRNVEVVFESGDAGQLELSKLLAAENIDVQYVAKRGVLAFDAGDLAAWKAKWIIDKVFEDLAFRERPSAREDVFRSMQQLDRMVQESRFFQADSLTKFCKEEGIPMRQPSH